MPRLAVDIVLLPSEPMTDRVIEVNSMLVRRNGEKIVLDRTCCFPHISLCMGVLKEKDLRAVSRILARIAEQTSPLKLTALRFSARADSNGEMISGFEIRPTKEIKQLHETIMAETAKFLTPKATPAMLAPPPPFSDGTFDWIKNYPFESSFRKFRPHITAGFGKAFTVKLPIRFTAEKLALCHLGNHCTCRKILAEASLRGIKCGSCAFLPR
jgi:2'-5' RNA ligase